MLDTIKPIYTYSPSAFGKTAKHRNYAGGSRALLGRNVKINLDQQKKLTQDYTAGAQTVTLMREYNLTRDQVRYIVKIRGGILRKDVRQKGTKWR